MDDRYSASFYEIEIGIVVPALIYAPVWLADQRGFLRDEGLTVRLRSFGSTDATTAALRDGVWSRRVRLLDQLAARQFVIASPTLIAAARRLYTDPRTGRQRRGAGAKGKGSPRRLALIANQLALTYDIHNMSVDQFMKILPREFH